MYVHVGSATPLQMVLREESIVTQLMKHISFPVPKYPLPSVYNNFVDPVLNRSLLFTALHFEQDEF
jgi:hypothetical protein